MAATLSGLSATGYGHAGDRAPRALALILSIPSRFEHLRRHSYAWAGLALLLLLLACIAGWRLSQAPSTGGLGGTSTPPSGSSVSRSRVDIGDAGQVHVAMRLQFATPVNELILHVPNDAGAPGAFQPTVVLLGVDVAGSMAPLEETLGAGETVSVPLDTAAYQIRLHYDATGTFVASTPSKPGRGLVLLTPLTVVEGDPLSMLEVVDARVLNLGCVGAEELSACGSRSGSRWIARPVAGTEQVVAQLDLKRR